MLFNKYSQHQSVESRKTIENLNVHENVTLSYNLTIFFCKLKITCGLFNICAETHSNVDFFEWFYFLFWSESQGRCIGACWWWMVMMEATTERFEGALFVFRPWKYLWGGRFVLFGGEDMRPVWALTSELLQEGGNTKSAWCVEFRFFRERAPKSLNP